MRYTLAKILALVLCVLVVSPWSAEAGRVRRRNAPQGQGNGQGAAAQVPFEPAQLPGAEFVLNTAYLFHASAQTASAAPSSHPAGAGSAVGTYADAANGHTLEALNASVQPVLITGVIGMRTGIQFTATTDVMQVDNSNTSIGPFSFFHQTGVFTFMTRVRIDANAGTSRAIIDNMNWSSANQGFTLACTNANVFQFQVARTGGLFVFNHTSAQACAVGSTYAVVARGNGNGGATFRVCPAGVTSLSGCSSAAIAYGGGLGTGAPAGHLQFGRATGGGTHGNSTIGQTFIGRYALSDADVETWLAYDPEYDTTTSLVRSSTSTGCGTNFCWGAYDFTLAATYGFQDTGCSTPVTTEGQAVACVININDSAGVSTYPRHLNRWLRVDAAGDEPLYRGTTRGVEFDGTNDNYDFSSPSIAMHAGIGASYLSATTCDDQTLGCHIAIASAHWVRSGTDHSPSAIHTIHTSPASDTPWNADQPLTNGGTAGSYECIWTVHDARNWLGAAQGQPAATGDRNLGGEFQIVSVGDNVIANWNHDGDYRRLIIINAYVPTIEARCP
jgi:hypothetical protein